MSRKKKENENLNDILKQIEKKFGKEIIINFDDEKNNLKIDVIPTGSLFLDKALGVGGIPKGRICEIYGNESTGKTSLALSIIRECQYQGGKCAFIDVEHAFDKDYAEVIGVDVKSLLFSQPDYGEQALDLIEALVDSKKFSLIVLDSVASLTPKAELEGDMEDNHIGLQARLMSQALRKLTAKVSNNNCCLLFINQVRENIKITWGGGGQVTTGGRALKFYASVRIELKRIGNITDGDEVVGSRIKAKIVKNKVSAPYRVAEFNIYFNEGVSKLSDIITMGLKLGVLEKSGAWYKYKGETVAQGEQKLREYLKNNVSICQEIEWKIKNE